MEFRTAAFKKDKKQPKSQTWLIYLLFSVIFVLLGYILNGMDLTSPITAAILMAGVICAYLIRYHKWGKKEKVRGYLDKDLIISDEFIKIDGSTIPIDRIEKIKFILDKYEDVDIYNYDIINRSDGVSNQIFVTIGRKIYAEFFRIGTEMHMKELEEVIKRLNKKAVNI